MEVDQLSFILPCPQLGDTNLRSALGAPLAELTPTFPLPDQESFPAQTDLSFGTSSQGSFLRTGPSGSGPGRLNPHGGNRMVTTATHGQIFRSCF